MQHSDNRDVVVLLCNFSKRSALSERQMPQDALYIQSTYLTDVCEVIQTASGVLISVQPDSILALFGLHHGLKQAALLSLQAAADIERTIKDTNQKLVRSWSTGIDFTVTAHAGHAVIREIDSGPHPVVIAVGEAIEVTNDLHSSAAQSGADARPFTISETVYAAAGISAGSADKVLCEMSASPVPLTVYRSASVPILAAHVRAHGRRTRVSALRRLWSG
jgi:class 3 adenylate cyclase